MVKFPNSFALMMADATGALLENSELKLYQSQITVTHNNTLAELDAVEADYSGYAAKTVSFGESYLNEAGSGANIRLQTQQFNYNPPESGTPVGNTIYGYYLVTAEGDLALVGELEEPVAMSSDGHACFVEVTIGAGNS